MTNSREIKNELYEQVARIGRAVANPKRLELIELLCQGEKNVEQLASEAEISVKLASAHLREMRHAHLVSTRRDGKNIYYRLHNARVADLWVLLRVSAEEYLSELQEALLRIVTEPNEITALDKTTLLSEAENGTLLLIDVRPQVEFDASHIPGAISIPIDELTSRLSELPNDRPIVAYCRGPFCMWAHQAVEILRKNGLNGSRINDGVAEWQASGLPLASNNR